MIGNLSRRFTIGLTLFGMGLLLLMITILLTWSRHVPHTARLSQSQILQKAVQYMQSSMPGKVLTVKSTRTTLGQVGGISCSPAGRLVSSLTYQVGLDSYNSCDPRTHVWLIELHGTFHWAHGNADSLQIVLDEKGNFIRADSGPLTP